MALTKVIGAGVGNLDELGVGTASPTTSYGKSLQIHDTGTSGANLRLTDSTSGSGTGNGLDIIQIGVNTHIINRESGSMTLYTSGDDGIIIDANGHVTMPKQSAFNATNNGTQSNIATGTQVTVALGTERFDVNADFASNTFTSPVTGKYQLNIFIRIDNLDSAAHYYELKINTSNSGYGIIMDPDFGQDQSYFNMAFAVLADMDASDTATVEIRQEGGTSQTDILDARFSGALLC